MSPGNTQYYIDAQTGDDSNSGTDKHKAWKTFSQLDRRIFSPGDRITVAGPAEFKESLFLVARGDSKNMSSLSF
ncbi:MAG: hypothetical protein EOP54_19285 [Sphingobacteriales bacterium]|nr:MAG: hypothetical protein EOP54_19285 [Sphingobacteriales bacterium]